MKEFLESIWIIYMYGLSAPWIHRDNGARRSSHARA